MSGTKKYAVAVLACLLVTAIALAASPRFIKCSKAAQGDNLLVSFKIAGLGNETTCVTVTADATAEYACFNRGGKNPSAANKRTVSEVRVASDCFPPRNGQITGSLTLTPPGPGDFTCPPGQVMVLIPGSVTYSNVQVVDTTHDITCTP